MDTYNNMLNMIDNLTETLNSVITETIHEKDLTRKMELIQYKQDLRKRINAYKNAIMDLV